LRAEVRLPDAGQYDYTFVQVIDVADTTEAAGTYSLHGKASAQSVKIELPVGRLILQGEPGARRELDLK